jgi:hypothetical protein
MFRFDSGMSIDLAFSRVDLAMTVTANAIEALNLIETRYDSS